MDKDREPKNLVIHKENATFWMDGRGRWHNQHGPFENKKVIDYFNTAIEWDPMGYFVIQQREGFYEKVYFPYEDTALFVVDILTESGMILQLNTRDRLTLMPNELFMCNDQLYIQHERRRIKFGERALLRIAEHIVFDKGIYYFHNANQHHPIPTVAPGSQVTEGMPMAGGKKGKGE